MTREEFESLRIGDIVRYEECDAPLCVVEMVDDGSATFVPLGRGALINSNVAALFTLVERKSPPSYPHPEVIAVASNTFSEPIEVSLFYGPIHLLTLEQAESLRDKLIAAIEKAKEAVKG